MRLVEIIRGEQTSDAVASLGAELAVVQGKFPIVVRDVPGFLVNRLLFPYLSEAVQLVLEGVPIDAVDRAAEEFGMFMGPLKTLDLVGFDVAREVAGVLTAAYPDRMYTPSLIASSGTVVSWQAVLAALSTRKVLGKKSGRGFYVYPEGAGRTSKSLPNPIFSDGQFWSTFDAAPPRNNAISPTAICDRLINKLIDEANRCLNEGVAGDEGAAAALQIDLASVLGFGFAPFRGGVMHYASRMPQAP
jgi:3-hydroxyacyl-CoA dehydrogenase